MGKISALLFCLILASILHAQEKVEELDVNQIIKGNTDSKSEAIVEQAAPKEEIQVQSVEEKSAKSLNDEDSKKKVSGKAATFFVGKTKIKDPFSLRDPFRSPLQKSQKKQNLGKGIIKDGIFTNLTSVEGATIEQLKIVGVLVGKDRRAMAKIGGNPNPVILKEGMILGEDGAELKAILPGGIVLVEKIVNVYGEEEYLETVIPISEEQ